ncbi:MAG: type VI secretion system ATPase TssH [Polyangiaceae bacterium]|nr:type VI secretion system ATPase TssH [Polyangiaceae bacterium]
MLLVEPRTLIDKLSPMCRRAFERAAGASMTARHREVTVEHVLLSLLDERESDFSAILEHYRVDATHARAALQKYIGEMSAGNTGKPVFSPVLFEWLQDAWLYASAELGAAVLPSGALLTRLLVAPGRYTAAPLDGFDQLPRDELRKELGRLTSHSIETASSPRVVQDGETRAAGDAAAGDSVLARFTTNLTERAQKGELDPVFCREGEVRQMVDILCRRRKNNPILVGEPGVGKTAIVEGLALRIAAGDIPDALKGTQVVVLDLGALQAGASMKGEFEKRFQGVIAEVKASPRPMILFIDEAHTLIGAGGAQGGGDAANLLKPALARGELRTIAATTWAEYKRYFEKDAALERRFQPVKVDEPSIDGAVVMLRGLAQQLEEAHGVTIRDEAVRAAVTLSSRYISGRQLPDKAVDLLDTSAARVRVLRGATPSILEDTNAKLSALESELGAFDRDFQAGLPVDDKKRAAITASRDELVVKKQGLEARLNEQRDLVASINELREAMRAASTTEKSAASTATESSSKATESSAPKDPEETRASLRAKLDELRAIAPNDRLVFADVDEELVSSIVADWTGIPVGRMVKDNVSAILSIEDRLRERVRGQDPALAVIGRELRSARSGLKPPHAPLGVFLLVGPSGVGKTETALSLADLLFGGERFVVTINMSEFQERHTVSRLIGSPPGYVGYGEGGVLTEAVRQRPYSVVLLDEVEKADREVMNLFYQVFDKGMLSDGEGRTIDFANTVVVLTSNLATDLLTRAADPEGPVPAHDDLIALVKPTLNEYFKPALLARMTVVPYVPIRRDALVGIVTQKLAQVGARMKEAHGADLVVEDAVRDTIAARCHEVESGARNVDHILRGSVLPLLSSTILRAIAEEKDFAKFRLSVDPASGNFQCEGEQA